MIQALIDFLGYFIEFNPPVIFPLQNILWGILIVNLILAIALFIKTRMTTDKKLKKVLRSYDTTLITIEILLTLNLLSRLNRVAVLSMRLFTFILIAWMIYSYVKIGMSLFRKPVQIS